MNYFKPVLFVISTFLSIGGAFNVGMTGSWPALPFMVILLSRILPCLQAGVYVLVCIDVHRAYT